MWLETERREDSVHETRRPGRVRGSSEPLGTFRPNPRRNVRPPTRATASCAEARIEGNPAVGNTDGAGPHGPGRFRGSKRWPRKKSLQKLKDSLRVDTSRASGRSMTCIIALVNRRLRGWFEYFKHSVRGTFRPLDGWLRRRLRSILRKRSKRRGIAQGADNHRWPNAFFAKHGLFSLELAHRLACQPSRR